MTLSDFMCGKQEVCIGYLGGSITEGAGVHDESLCYRALMTQLFREAFKEQTIREINAGIGGTPSEFGAYRLREHLLAYEPDLVFVEFAVNDMDSKTERSLEAVEGIVRQIHAHRRDIPVILLLCATKIMMKDYYDKGVEPYSVTAHKETAEYYQIPFINMGKALWEKIRQLGADVREYLPDGIHPNEKGHVFYADDLWDELQKIEITCPREAKKRCEHALVHVKLLPAAELTADGWEAVRKSRWRYALRYLQTDQEGTKLTISFTGTAVGLYWIIAADSGSVRYSIDHGEVKELSCYDDYAKDFDRTGYVILESGLEETKHVLTLVSVRSKRSKRRGSTIRIAGVLINQGEEDKKLVYKV